MLDFVVSNWWIGLQIAIVAVFAFRLWANLRFRAWSDEVLTETQAGFASGDITIHSVAYAGSTIVDGETATRYEIDATIVPSTEPFEWAGADLFLYGIDEDGDSDPMRIGEVRQVQRWNGSSFESIKRGARHQGTQRLKLSIRFAGKPGPTRFNYNFACFGPVFELPAAESEAQLTEAHC